MNTPITTIELYKHGFYEEELGIWQDQHYRIFMFERDGLYHQCFENDNSVVIGVPFATIEELQRRYESITGRDFPKEGERLITGQ